jgi:hypothetical protein
VIARRSGEFITITTAVQRSANPELIILGAQEELVQSSPPAGSSSEYFMRAIREALKDNAFGTMADECKVLVAPLNLEVAACGAALLAETRAVSTNVD